MASSRLDRKLGRDQQTLRGRPAHYERASAVIINDWESVIDNDQTELLEPLKEGVIRKEQIHELGDLLTGKRGSPSRPADRPRRIIYYKNNSGLAIQFAAAAASCIARRLRRDNKTIRPNGSERLVRLYKPGFDPRPDGDRDDGRCLAGLLLAVALRFA